MKSHWLSMTFKWLYPDFFLTFKVKKNDQKSKKSHWLLFDFSLTFLWLFFDFVSQKKRPFVNKSQWKSQWKVNQSHWLFIDFSLTSFFTEDEDCIPFMLNKCGCLNAIPKLQFMQSRRAKICILSEDRILMILMCQEQLSELHCIIRWKYVPSSTPWQFITLLSCKNADIDCISKITLELYQSMVTVILLGGKHEVHFGT